MKSKFVTTLGASILLWTNVAVAQNDPWRAPATRSVQDQKPDQQQQAPAAASTRVVNGTVVSFQEGKTIKLKTSDGKIESFNLKEATVGSGIKIGSSVRVTDSRDANGVRSLTVEPAQSEAS